MTLDGSKDRVLDALSAIFSPKPSVAMKRITILKILSNSLDGKMKFKEVLDGVLSEMKNIDYTSQQLTYDLHVLKQKGLVTQTWDGMYTITEDGLNILRFYQEITHTMSEFEKPGKNGFVGEVNGRIIAEGFNPRVLGKKLAKHSFFRKRGFEDHEKTFLELNCDDENLISEIEIRRSGHFTVRVVLFNSDTSESEVSVISDFEKNEEWYETVKGLAQTIVYFIKRAAKELWPNSNVDIPFPADAYPI